MEQNRKKTITILVFLTVLLASAAAGTGIFSDSGPGLYEYESIRGETVLIYGKGLYRHMSADVAVQGIAQDYVTLFAAIPMLLISLYLAGKGSLKGLYLLAGTAGYFFVTYLFYTVMGMYNIMFLPYVMLLCLSFFTLANTLLSFTGVNIFPAVIIIPLINLLSVVFAFRLIKSVKW